MCSLSRYEYSSIFFRAPPYSRILPIEISNNFIQKVTYSFHITCPLTIILLDMSQPRNRKPKPPGSAGDSFDFGWFSEDLPDPQASKIYAYSSRVKELMKEKEREFDDIQTRKYTNNILQQECKYQVPVVSHKKRDADNESYKHFYSTHRRFSKPYGMCAKYSDSLNRHQSVLRRRQFDTPVQHSTPQARPASAQPQRNPTRYFKSSSFKKSFVSTTPTTPINQQQSKESKESLFDKSIARHMKALSRLRDVERSRKQAIEFNNSMNRLLTAEMITGQAKPLHNAH